jgi:membrane protease YdiL (CAAX protease family)
MSIALAVVRGIAVLFGGSLPWGFLLAPANLRFGKAVPWAIVPMAAWLWAYWRFISGDWGSPETAASRRALSSRQSAVRRRLDGVTVCRLSRVRGPVRISCGLGAAGGAARLGPLTAPERMPAFTAFLLLTMSSIVAGVTEESAFRGYMQTPLSGATALCPRS